ncbi:hypothetical protein [Effusibacillus lacus]|uniref:hypothetical protein n=1 Tax=Effusibacillus lacus TaxID=1348429 RepID=UPI000BB7CD1B|nr:hypothetical protein [Effusibacillus lacus]TCS75532.1 hypothetical protein EDD64_10789 [Effusibacillus lacus]
MVLGKRVAKPLFKNADDIGGAGSNVVKGSDNVAEGTGKFAPDENGFYGTKGLGGSHTRNLPGGDNAAQDLMKELTQGATKIEQKGNVTIAHMPDGQRVVYRPISSSDGTPVVEIHGKGAIKEQKIHFVD